MTLLDDRYIVSQKLPPSKSSALVFLNLNCDTNRRSLDCVTRLLVV